MAGSEDHFTIFVRLPFGRGEFVDPPPVAWSAAKERELWEVLSKSSRGNEIDWKGLSERFRVTQSFLLQQAAWLYERQLSQVRAQMRRMGNRSSSTASPIPQSNTASVSGGQPMRRTGSGGSRVPSRLATQLPVTEGSTPTTPSKGRLPVPTRTTSQGGTTHTKTEPVASRTLSRRTSKENEVASRTHSRRGSVQHQITRSPKQDLTHHFDSSSEEEVTQSRILHRRPNPAASRRITQGRKSVHARRPSAPQVNEEDEEDKPAFLPFSNNSSETAKGDASLSRDAGATIRGGINQSPRPLTYRRSTSEKIVPQQAQNSEQLTSSTSSTSEMPSVRPRVSNNRQQAQVQLPNPLSPHQQAALAAAAGLSPRLRRTGNIGGHGSDTSPSMGSSFSDLDDASVTQSALEEALLSGMGNTTMTVGGGNVGTVGNVANRVSGISQALRSRYFDARGSEAQH